MSDEATCVYCGQARYGKEVLAPGAVAHTLCVYPDDPQRLSAEHAALAAGLDAVVAAFEAQTEVIPDLESDIVRLLYERNEAVRRAEAADAQLAAARADGARSMAATLAEHWLAGIECDHETLADRPSCACSRINFGWYRSVGEAVNRWVEHVLAAWQAAQETEPTDARA